MPEVVKSTFSVLVATEVPVMIINVAATMQPSSNTPSSQGCHVTM